MRYRADIGINDCATYVDLFWIVWLFIALRILFDILWAATTNDGSNFRNYNNNWWLRWANIGNNTNNNLNNNLTGGSSVATLSNNNVAVTNMNNINGVLNGNNSWFSDWLAWSRWRTVVLSAITEAIIGFLIALVYLWWQALDEDDRQWCTGQDCVLRRGYVRNAIALLIAAIALVIAQWYYVNYNFGTNGRVIIRNVRQRSALSSTTVI